MALDILVVDDEADICDLVSGILEDEGHQARTAANSQEASAEIVSRLPSLVILDIWLQDSEMDGLALLEWVKHEYPDLPVVMISGHGSVETAVASIKKGATDFIEKPFKSDHLLYVVERASEAERLRRENAELKRRAGLDLELLGQSSSINTLRQAINKVAPSNSRVLIQGPPGAGKEVAARLLHARSRRAQAPFVVAAAASIEPEGMEEALFGIEAGGRLVKTGLFEQANGGTLFFDEVADMPGHTQAKILRVLTEQTFERVGGNRRVQVDVRVVSASNRDLREEVAHGRFREDLFHRLSVVPIAVPALAERREDIPGLVDHFLDLIGQTAGRARPRVDDAAMAALQAYDWPGNVRQLKNVVERMLIMLGDAQDEITLEMLPPELAGDSADLLRPDHEMSIMTAPLREAREAFEREYLRIQINRFSGNVSKTASFIGMERSALHRKLKTLGLTGVIRGRDA
ncbi:sigma-54-dependent Fis family transcriptional regulator [Rhodothalassium salexigens]|uniref:nitrogen assimilation response regulator NtrX n=1 Tax=Rhodothalassium salexigens TaxID=1086 RepID=UPI001913058A|nr:sigma-54 dependent transcriptional regulator [Rhodothalassium salexigens]MBK5911859.1 sigma-54-dependent Fis family transcriptional regulator [Rhodothalassium salexigens]